MSNTQDWVNDEAFVEQMGDAWVEDIELGRCDMDTAAGRAAAVDIANAWLEENGRTERVVDVRESTTEDNLDWVLA